MPRPLIILITDLNLGGSPLMVRALARGLRNRGDFDPTVVSIAPLGPVADLLAADGVRVVSLNVSTTRQWSAALGRWVALTCQIHAHLVHSVLLHANMLATLGRPFAPPARYIHAIHTLQEHPHWHWVAQGILSGLADGLIAPTPAILARLARYGPVNHGVTIPNGVDLERFRTALPLASTVLPWPPHARVVGYIGRFDPVKRLPELLLAFDLLTRNNKYDNDLHLALIGYGPMEPALRALTGKLGLASRVHFPGPTLTPEQWYKSLDLLCLPSDAEGFGLTVVEALAAGLPVVAVRTPAITSVLGSSLPATLGRLADSPSPDTLAVAIQAVMDDPARCHLDAVQTRRAAVTRYGCDAMVEAYNRIFTFFLRE